MSLRPVFLAIVTRRALSDYLAGVGLAMFILLLVAYTIDLASEFADIRQAASKADASLASVLAPYLLQRGADIVARMLPVAVFFGTFLAEIFRRQRLESVILATAGASPLRSYAAVLWLALILGAAMWVLESRVRPALVWAQVESGLGNYADRFRKGWQRDRWYVIGDVALRGDVWRAEAPYLRDVLIFRGLRSDGLTEILGARRMEPGPAPYQWDLTGVTRYDVAAGSAPQPAPDMTLDLDLIPDQLAYRGFLDLFLPNDTLEALVQMRVPPDNASAVHTERWRRWTIWLLPGVIAFLAVGMANMGFEGRRILIPRLIGLAVIGYWYVTAIKVVGKMGALDLLAPWLSIMAPLAAALGLAGWLAWRQS